MYNLTYALNSGTITSTDLTKGTKENLNIYCMAIYLKIK